MNPNQPTRFANWSRYFSANRDAATSEADKLAEQQRKAAEAAQQSTGALVTQFAQKAGVGEYNHFQGQRPQQSIGRTNGLATNVGAGAAQQPPTNVGAGAVAAPAPAVAQPAPTTAPAAPGYASGSLAEAQANSQRGYNGPAELQDLEGADAAYQQNLAAQKGLNQLGHEGGIQALSQSPHQSAGEARFGAALIGSAGRGKFDRLRGQFSLQQGWQQAEERAKALAAAGTDKAKAEAAKWAEEADRLKLAAGNTPDRTLGYGPNGESSGADPAGKGIGGHAVRDRLGDYETYAKGTNNGLQSGADWFHRNVSRKLWDSMNDQELDALTRAIAAAGGERNADVDAQIAALTKKYGG